VRRRFFVFVATAATLVLLTRLHLGIGATGIMPAVWAALILGLFNLLGRPVVRCLTLPFNILTLGLFGLVVSALVLWGTTAFVPGFYVNGFMPALWGAIILGLVSGVVGWVVK
jgi:putative membrane protein